MTFEPELYNYVNGLAGLAIALVGALIAVLRRPGGNLPFGVLLACFGMGYFLDHLLYSFDEPHWGFLVGGISWGLAALAAPWAAMRFGADARKGTGSMVVATFAAAAASGTAVVWVYLAGEIRPGSTEEWAGLVGQLSFMVMIFAMNGLAFALAWRFRKTKDPAVRHRLAIAGLALGMYLGSIATSGAFSTDASFLEPAFRFRFWGAMMMAWVAATLAMWIVAARGARDTALGVAVASGPLVFALAGIWVAIEGDFFFGERGMFHGAARLTAFLVLAVAILADDFLGIGWRMRAGVSRGVVAGVFVAAIFVVTESAQTAFSERMGPWAGIVAAGSLVFLMVPLQVAVDRFLHLRGGRQGKENTYSEQLRLVWKDGTITRKELEVLEKLRNRLRLDADAAARLEKAVLSQD